METPATYYGYDKDGNQVAVGTAEDATAYLDPNQVKKAIEKVQKVVEEQMQYIATALQQVSESAEDAIIIQGTKMSGTIDDITEIVKNLPAQLLSGIDQLYDVALNSKNSLQAQLNNQAYNAVASCNGVVSIN